MRILITNDDGIRADSLRVLVEWAAKLGEVTVAAPKFEQSGKSHGIELHKSYEVKRSDIFGDGVTAYAVDSTPADCVRFAVAQFGRYDLLLSGINNGLNAGEDIVYSGTCGALFEAAIMRMDGVALSSDSNNHAEAAKELDGVFEYIKERGLLEKCQILNVNIPKEPRGTLITRQGGGYYRDRFIETEKDMFRAEGYTIYEDNGDLSLDTNAVNNGYISITPMTTDRTDIKAFELFSK